MKLLSLIFKSFILFSLISCSLPYSDNSSYKDSILNIYVSEDATYFIMVGEKFHYVSSPLNQNTQAFFLAQNLVKYTPNNFDFNLHKEANETISFNLSFKIEADKLDATQKNFLENHNISYLERKDGKETNLYTGGFFFKGKRYRADANFNRQIVKLQKTIAIKIAELDTKDKATSTPIKINDAKVSFESEILQELFH